MGTSLKSLAGKKSHNSRQIKNGGLGG